MANLITMPTYTPVTYVEKKKKEEETKHIERAAYQLSNMKDENIYACLAILIRIPFSLVTST